MLMENLFHDYGHDFEDGDDEFFDMEVLAAAEQLGMGAKALAEDGSILDLSALSSDSCDFNNLMTEGASSSSVNADATGKECTGRWTRDEHLLFIKGLEMYGKGWKKIAGLIKTRTVVQIRTHAQKYFLKLAKARQNGGGDVHCGSLSLDGKSFCPGMRKKKHRRRRYDKPIALAPPLQPYVKISKEGAEAPEPNDVDTGLYQFLSAPMGTLSTTPSLLHLPVDETASNADNLEALSAQSSPLQQAVAADVIDGKKFKLPSSASCNSISTSALPTSNVQSSNSLTSFSGVMMVERLRLNSSERSLPEWYAKGEHVSALLKEAEALDWGAELHETQKRQSRSDINFASSSVTSPNTITAALESLNPYPVQGHHDDDIADILGDFIPHAGQEVNIKIEKDECSNLQVDAPLKIDVRVKVEEAEILRQVGSKASFSAISTDGSGNTNSEPLSLVIEGQRPRGQIQDNGALSGRQTPLATPTSVDHSTGKALKKLASEIVASSTPIALSPVDKLSKATSAVASSSPSKDANSDTDEDALGGIVF